MQIEHRGIQPYKIIDQSNMPLREGGIVTGRVLKLLPEGLVELGIGQQVLTAGTAANLKEGMSYRFIVTELGSQPVLKLLEQQAEPVLKKTQLLELLSKKDSFDATTRDLLTTIGRRTVEEGSGQALKQAILELHQLARDAGSGMERKLSDQLLGQQLVPAGNEQGKGQFLFQVPYFGPFEDVEVRIDAPFEKKEFDPDHARLALYLKLPALGETLLDVLVNERRVSISVYHEEAFVGRFMDDYAVKLTEALAQEGYQLHRFEHVAERRERTPVVLSAEQGRVDYKA